MSNESDTRPDTQLHTIGAATLTPLVRQALGSDTLDVASWDAQQIHGGVAYSSAGGSAIYRFWGHGRDQGKELDWSLILKALYPPADRGQPSDWNYWRRHTNIVYEGGYIVWQVL